MKEIPEIHIIEAEHEGNPLNLYLLGDNCLLDTGVISMPEAVIFPFLRKLKIEPNRLSIVCITHAHGDHSWGLGPIKRLAPAVTSMAHELDIEWIEDPEKQIRAIFNPYVAWLPNVDQQMSHLRHMVGSKVRVNLALKGNERLVLDSGWDLEIVHTPGHSPGHIILYNRAFGCAFIGDAILSKGQRVGKNTGFPHYHDVDAYLQSIQKIQSLLPLRYLFTSHFGVLQEDDISHFIDSSREFVQDAETMARQVLAETNKAMSLWDVAESVRQRLGSYAMSVVVLITMEAHLKHLRQAGIIESIGGPKGQLWKLIT